MKTSVAKLSNIVTLMQANLKLIKNKFENQSKSLSFTQNLPHTYIFKISYIILHETSLENSSDIKPLLQANLLFIKINL